MWLLIAIFGNVFWSASDVTNSILVHHYEKDPVRLVWYKSLSDFVFLAILALFIPLQTTWLPLFVLAGFSAYLAALIYIYVIRHIDVSVMNSAWVFLAIAVSVGSFYLFAERWTVMQSVGVGLSVIGVLILSFWHKHVSWFYTMALLCLLGVSYAPYYLIQKAALLSGENVLATFFWPYFFINVFAFIFPILTKKRATLFCLPKVKNFPFVCLIASLFSILGSLLFTIAYQNGLASLVATTENVQPFTTIFFAWVLLRLIPQYAPRELLTAQSVQIKLVSFVIVFVGLTMLAI